MAESSESASTSSPLPPTPVAEQPSSSSAASDTQPASEASTSAAQDSTTADAPKKKKPKTWEPLSIPNPMQIMQEDIMNNCFIKGGFSGAMGGVAGFAFGLFSASMENAGGGPMTDMSDVREKPTRVVLKEMYTNMKSKSLSYAKGFAYFGALYSFNECVIEKYRAKHDRVNAAAAGCATGAMMAYSGGPQAMCIGCVSVGAFSLAIDHFLDL